MAKKKEDDIVEVVKKKPRGKPVQESLAPITEPGDNTKYLQVSMKLMQLPDIDLKDANQVAKRLEEYFSIQAEADLKIAQAKAEERRAMAVALEQEMKAKAEEARANVIQAEAEVPKAMAEAFRSGNLGIMDYYRMKNIQADTDMRQSIAQPDTDYNNIEIK